MLVMTWRIANVTGHRAPPSAGTTPIGSANAISTRATASARIAVLQMTVQVRQIRRNRGDLTHRSSHDRPAGRTQDRVAESQTRRPSSSGREMVNVAGRLESGRPRERAGRGGRGGAGARPILAVRSELPARYQFNGPFPAGPPETGGAIRSESERASGPAVSRAQQANQALRAFPNGRGAN